MQAAESKIGSMAGTGTKPLLVPVPGGQIVPHGAAVPMVLTAEQVDQIRQSFLASLPIPAAFFHQSRHGAPVILAANDAFKRLCGQLNTQMPAPLLSIPLFAPERMGRALDMFLSGDKTSTSFDWHDGSLIGGRYFTITISELQTSRPDDRRCIIAMVDRTAEVETERSLRAEMSHDSLTGLPNRVAFIETVEAVLEAASGSEGPGMSHAVLVVDLTRFSRVNECMGAIAGDELIITVARRLLSALRAGDRLARIGGDEFAILLRISEGPADALQAAERIRRALSSPFRLADVEEVRIDCAVGCAYLGEGVPDAEEIVRNAQFALKRAKASGRIEVYQQAQAVQARERFSLETELRRAIERRELTLAYQPLIDLATGKVAKFEALARWTHAERGFISPADFIPVAEESGLIMPLGRWALEAATRTMADWDARAGRALPISMCVNVSAIQIARDDVCSVVADVLASAGLSGERLTLELTESAIISDPERAARIMHPLKELGARIAMDDFGTGYSSLAYLQRLPIDMLKIDRSFVTDMLANRDSVAIVRAILGLADALGMDTTAEGVETVELAQTLGALGCTHGQGYYFARPLDMESAYAYLVNRNG